MENLNAIRKIDELGRIVLPNDLMQTMGWARRDSILITFNKQDDAVTMKLHEKAPEPKCDLCKEDKPKVTMNGVGICEGCIERFKAM